ncbi:MAG: hypothetical protein HYX34_12345 [Actinobacteria bacterium]|nr:hypothetical protein [Actinomycetota bacterium]
MLTDAFAAAATLISLAFALCTFERWLARRRRHELAWSVSLVLFAAGSMALWAGAALGWASWSLRAFYLFGGVLNVPFLALGTVYLLGGTRLGDRVGASVALLGAFAAGVVVTAPTRRPVAPDVFPTGKVYFGVLPRVLAAVGSGLAASVIIGGALWSAARLLRGRTRPAAAGRSGLPAGRLAAANVLIAVGTLIISAKQIFAGLGDEETAFSAAVAVGIAGIFAGFLLTSARPVAAGQAPPTMAGALPPHASDRSAGGPPSVDAPPVEPATPVRSSAEPVTPPGLGARPRS